MFVNLIQQVKLLKLFLQLEDERMDPCMKATPSSPVCLDSGL